MGFLNYLTKQRHRYSIELVNDNRYWSLSALTLTDYRMMIQVFPKYINGQTLDAGAGDLNLRPLVKQHCTGYTSLDVEKRHPEIDIIGDLQNMDYIDENTYDTVVCFHVLEHLPKPWKAMSEIFRILKPGGYAIVSVPHLSALHEEPHDFFRYTHYGMESLLKASGLNVIETRKVTGLLSFISHPFSLILVTMTWGIPVLRWIIWAINKLLLAGPAIFLDRISGLERKYPAGVLVVAQKPLNQEYSP